MLKERVGNAEHFERTYCFEVSHPTNMHLHLTYDPDLSTLTDALRTRAWIASNDRVLRVEKPGEGNMNLVLRVVTAQKSLILKQANPFVQKYPSIPAPTERVAVEAAFYGLASQKRGVKTYLPNCIGFDPENHLLAVEDLGDSTDYTAVYQKNQALSATEIAAATLFLARLHRARFPNAVKAAFPPNLALRQLNHAHLFHFPFLLDNGFDLDTVQPGLQALSLRYKTDAALKDTLRVLGEVYLSPEDTLLHGDYYPGSWLKTGQGFKVIDPEFCFFGPAEYDLGVFFAHLILAQTPVSALQTVLPVYKPGRKIDLGLMAQFTGMELLRRIIGLAQLPLELRLEERAALLENAAALLKDANKGLFV